MVIVLVCPDRGRRAGALLVLGVLCDQPTPRVGLPMIVMINPCQQITPRLSLPTLYTSWQNASGYTTCSLKKKITGSAAIFTQWMNEKWFRLSLCQSTDALGAKYLAYLLSILVNRYGLEVWTESSRGSLFRPGPVPTEGSLFSTVCTLSHVTHSFLVLI